jgi:protein TonB
MFSELLETRAHRQRRFGGATMSVAAHVAIVGVIAASTAHGRSAPKTKEPPPPKVVFVEHPSAPVRAVPQTATTQSAAPRLNVIVKHVDVPTFVPHGLPPIDVGAHAADSIIIGGGGESHGLAGQVGNVFGDDSRHDSNTWNAIEIQMHILEPARPRYPESLRSAGIEGRVLVEFTVDTLGRVDASSVKVLDSTHELFTKAAKDALSAFRFRPAEASGHKLSARAQMPFEFTIRSR